MTDKERAVIVIAPIVERCHLSLHFIQDIVAKNQNQPPEGQADGSLHERQWIALRDIATAMQSIVNNALVLSKNREDYYYIDEMREQVKAWHKT